GKMSDHEKQSKFLAKMGQYGYKVKSKEVKLIKISKDTYERKGNLYVELVIDALKNINNFDTCVLMSGDSDFASLLDELKENKKRVIVLSTKGHISRELIERAKYINIRKLKDSLILGE
ncbi:MAG: NYN domain-containing protein, partial [bacterium]|nr:NYN domain-containing protein [bacterium]